MPDQPSTRHRAAVVLFVDSGTVQAQDIGNVLSHALYLNGARKNGLSVTINGQFHHIRIVDIMDAGLAAGNGYLWTEPTYKAWRDSEHRLNERGLK